MTSPYSKIQMQQTVMREIPHVDSRRLLLAPSNGTARIRTENQGIMRVVKTAFVNR